MATMDWGSQGGSGPQNYQDFLVPAMFTPFAETLVVKAGIHEGSRVLDVACGTGAASRVAARLAGSRGSVTGVDLGEPTLDIARAFPAEQGAAPIDYRQGDAVSLPVEHESFDVTICQQGLQFFPDKLGALRAMHAALRPGGRVAIATWTAIETNPFGVVRDALRGHAGQEAADMMASPFRLPREQLEESLVSVGFGGVDVQEETQVCTWASTPADFAVRTISAGPIAPLFFDLPVDVRRAVAEDTATLLRSDVDADGNVQMPMTSLVALARA